MLTDKDRKQSKNVLYSYPVPVAYAMKGKAYDGQWHKFVTEDKKGQALTKLHGCDNWNKVSSMSKDKCINEISMLSVVKKSTQELLKAENLDKGIVKTVQDIQIKKGLRSELHVTLSKQIMQYLHSVHPCS